MHFHSLRVKKKQNQQEGKAAGQQQEEEEEEEEEKNEINTEHVCILHKKSKREVFCAL